LHLISDISNIVAKISENKILRTYSVQMIKRLLTRKRFPFYRQADSMDCGPTCLKMIAAWYGRNKPIAYFRRICSIGKQGTTLAGLNNACGVMGMKHLALELPLEVLMEKAPLPCILHWEKRHYVVLIHINAKRARIADPSLDQVIDIPIQHFLRSWLKHPSANVGTALFIQPGPGFYELEPENDNSASLWSLFPYMKVHTKAYSSLLLSIMAVIVFSLAIPILTQQIVDKGIKEKSVHTLAVICLAQLMLFAGKTVMDFIRARWLFKIGAITSITLLHKYLDKLLKLPFTFFDNRQAGDNMQRVTDNQRIEDFLTGAVINFAMAILTLLILGAVLLSYDYRIFGLFLLGAAGSLAWSVSMQQKRKLLDQKKFKVLAASQQLQLEIFYAMQEIKLSGNGGDKKQKWQSLQQQAFDLKLESLRLDQFMQGIGVSINEVKNIFISFFAAFLVIQGSLSLGVMLAITYICGQLNAPVLQLIEFIRSSQNASFSLKRIAEIYEEPDEDFHLPEKSIGNVAADISLQQLNFSYGQPGSPLVLKNINVVIPAGKVTAIVGMSGSGKSTLIKILLKFYQPRSGNILVGQQALSAIHANQWRRRCGVVMQDGYIFSDSVAQNIYGGAAVKDEQALHRAATLANMHDFFLSMPFGYDTVIGKDGYGLSEGQQQRLLIARMIYRNPSYLFMDEATNALDANNERVIVNNLQEFFTGKTVLIVAHRLSTVKNADQIIVMHKGEIIETGSHHELITQKGSYYHLVKNQLELAK